MADHLFRFRLNQMSNFEHRLDVPTILRSLILLLLLFISLGARAETLLHDLAVLPDKDGTLNIETVAATDPGQFKPLRAGSFAGGFTRSALWFRFTVAQAGETWLDIQPPMLDDLRLFTPDPVVPGGWRERRAGDTLPFATREVPYRGFIFKLHHVDDAPRTYYLRLQTSSTSILSPRLWSPADFIAATTLESSLLMASIAVILVVLLLNVNTWLWLRDPLTPWFLLYLLILSVFFLCATGFLQQYLFPELPVASYYATSGSTLLLIAVANAFYRRFFGIERDRPVLYWLYRINTWLPVLVFPAMLLGHFNWIGSLVNGAAMLMTFVGLLMSWRAWRRGSPGAGMMLVANLISMVGILFLVANVLGVLAGGFVLWNSLHISAFGSILALQLALGAHTRALRDARLLAEQEALREREERIRQGQFLAMLAHELRTSLTVLRMAIGSQPMTPKAISSAERAMIAMGEVIDSSVQAEKLAEGQIRIEPLPCDIAGLVEAVIADSRDPARIRANLVMRPTCETDGRLLRIVIANLVDNALKYGKAGTPVAIDLGEEDGRLRLVVRNVIGSAGAPDPVRIFEKYYRAPQAHEITGSGLGLHVAAALSRLLGGELHYRPAGDRLDFELCL